MHTVTHTKEYLNYVSLASKAPCAVRVRGHTDSLSHCVRQKIHVLGVVMRLLCDMPKRGAFAGELLYGCEQGTISIFDLNKCTEPVATLEVSLLTYSPSVVLLPAS